MTRRLRVSLAVGALFLAIPVVEILRAAGPAPLLPQRLSETGLYRAGQPGIVADGNRAFAPQYPLWSDGLTKRRWVHLPPGARIGAADPWNWDFPAGTKFWKEFSHNGRRIETRLLSKTTSGWAFATYVWNADGSDAVLAPAEGVYGAAELAPGRSHAIPATTDCLSCHGGDRPRPLGFNPLQLSTDRDPNALHAEPLAAGMLTLKELVEEGWLPESAQQLVADPPRIRTSNAATRAALGYLASNCGTCHDGSAAMIVAGPSLQLRELVEDGDAVARRLVAQPSVWQLPGAPGGTMLIAPGSPEASALLARMRSRSPSSQMPPLGTVLRDEAAVQALSHWIKVELVR